MNTHTIVVEMHQNMLRTREDTDNQGRAVSDTRALCITERTLTTTQFQRRSVAPAVRESTVLHSYLAWLENRHLHPRRPTLAAAN